jgi:GNAT superfamily N-acetyltransferase
VSSGERVYLRDGVASYVADTAGTRPHADLFEVHGSVEEAASAVLTQLPGWALSCDPSLAAELEARGARIIRRADEMTYDLDAHPVPASWARPVVPPGLTIEPLHQPAEELVDLWRAAYPSDHVDHDPRAHTAEGVDFLGRVLRGDVLGPVLPYSGSVTSRGGRAVAACIVTDRPGASPHGGTWVTELFRDPDPEYAGIGRALLQRALALAGAAGRPAVGLVVSTGNPARELYLDLGFDLVTSSVSLVLPD